MNASERRLRGTTLAAFALLVTIGGANFVAVRTSNEELDPFWGATLRFGLASLVLLAIAGSRGLSWPRGRALADTVLYGVLGFALSYALVYWALVRVTAAVATIVLALVPLLTLLLAVAQGLERLTGRAVAGGVLAIAGIAWMSAGADPGELPLSALVALLVGAAAAAQSVIYAKRVSGNHPVMTNAVAMAAGALILLLTSLVAGESWVAPREPEVIWSVVYLVLLGSAGMFLLMLLVVRSWTASASSYAFVLFPVVTLLVAAWLLDEPMTARAVAGALLVMVGVWFGALTAPKPVPATVAALEHA